MGLTGRQVVTTDRLPQDYVLQTKRIPYLSLEEEVDCARRWRDHGDEKARERLITAHLRYVLTLANKYRAYGMPIDELVAEGNAGLLRALKGFDPDRGIRFSTYAQWWIKAALFDYIFANTSTVRIPSSPALKTMFYKLRRVKSDLGITEDVLSEANLNRIAAHFGVRPDQVATANTHLNGDASLNDQLKGDEGKDTFLDLLVSHHPGPEEALIDAQLRQKIDACIDLGLSILKPRERDIMIRRTLAEDPMTLEELSRDYGVTKQRIQQIEKMAQAKFAARIRKAAPLNANSFEQIRIAA